MLNGKAPVSVLIAVKDEERNIGRCLEALHGWADEIVVVDSHSTDNTVSLAESYGATVIQFDYTGGWPKKRQWALDTYPFRNDWIFIVDADEIVTDALKDEIVDAIQDERYSGFKIRLNLVFLGRQLKHGYIQPEKTCLFKKGMGQFEKLLDTQDHTMADMEIHEHIVADGELGALRHPLLHENYNSLDRYIIKHNEYSNWEARVLLENADGLVKPRLFGTKRERRRWLKRTFIMKPGSPLFYFIYYYLFRLGFLDGTPGFIYYVLKGIQIFHVKAKIYEHTHIDQAL